MSRQSHPHLLGQQLKSLLKSAHINMLDILSEHNINYFKLDRNYLLFLLQKVKSQVVSQSSYLQFQQQAHQRMHQLLDSLYSSDSRRHSYMVDLYKEATAFPLIKERQETVFNLQPLYRKIISKQLRRVVWSRLFNHDKLRKKYVLLQRQVTPYKVEQQLKLALSKLAQMNELVLKQNQRDAALRIMQYFVKAYNKVPHRYHNYIALNVIDLYSFHPPSKIADLGAVALGLVGLADSYKEADVEVRFGRIMRAISIVDRDSAEHIQECYLDSGNGKRELNECFQYFRLTLGASHLSLPTSQFLIDQLIIRKHCSFDIYVMFAITVLILSDEFDKQVKQKPSLKVILDRAKTIVKLVDFVEAYCAIYSSIPPFHSADHLLPNYNNELLLEMIACEGGKPQREQQGFVIELDEVARIGKKMGDI